MSNEEADAEILVDSFSNILLTIDRLPYVELACFDVEVNIFVSERSGSGFT